MLLILIQTDIGSLLGVVFGALFVGVIGAWLFFRKRYRPGPLTKEESEDDTLYLLISRLGHRLKTAGEVIRGHLHGFAEQLPTDAERWRVARSAIAEEASGIDQLTSRLDLVVRAGVSGHALVLEPVNIPRLLEDIMINLGPSTDEKGIVLGGIVSNPSETVDHVSADVAALREVFSNLLDNAVRHNGPGTEIAVEVSQDANELAIRIRDSGKGIPKEVLSNLFSRGGSRYRPHIAKGSGMGLYLCKLLVELHGGRIDVTSEEGKGTEFIVRMPNKRVS